MMCNSQLYTTAYMLKDRLKELREERGLSQQDVGDVVNLTHAAYGYYERGDRDPSTETLAKLADFYDCSVDYILGLTNVRKKSIRIDEKNAVPIPVLGVIRAGTPILASENIEGYVAVTPREAADGDYFYLRVTGDSMNNAGIKEGYLVYVRRQDDVDHRDIAVVIINGDDATLKRIIKTESGIYLQPESSNPAHLPMFFTGGKGDFHIIGKVLHWKGFPK